MSKPLPARPDLDQLRKQTKDLLKSFHSGHPDALRRRGQILDKLSRMPVTVRKRG